MFSPSPITSGFLREKDNGRPNKILHATLKPARMKIDVGVTEMMKTSIIFLVSVVIIGTCRAEDEKVVRDDWDLKEYIMTNLIFKVYGTRTNTTIYLAFSGKPDRIAKKYVYIDPPNEFLKRFSDSPVPVKPASQFIDRRIGDFSKETKMEILLTLQILEWLSEKKVRVKLQIYRGPMAQGENELICEKNESGWVITNFLPKWFS